MLLVLIGDGFSRCWFWGFDLDAWLGCLLVCLFGLSYDCLFVCWCGLLIVTCLLCLATILCVLLLLFVYDLSCLGVGVKLGYFLGGFSVGFRVWNLGFFGVSVSVFSRFRGQIATDRG